MKTTALIKQTGGKLVAAPAMQAATSATDLINAYKEFKKTQEVEKTKRKQIAADRDVRLETIREQASILKSLIDKTFTEREKNFNQFFSILEDGFNNNDDKKINIALNLIVEQTKVSPMAQAVSMMQQIQDPDVKYIDV